MQQYIGVLLDLEGSSVLPETEHGYTSVYIKEVLGHAGLPFEVIERRSLLSSLGNHRLIILPWDVALNREELEAIESFVRAGGALMALGGTSGLDSLLGCKSEGFTGNRFQHGYLNIVDADHPVTSDLASPLHVFRGTRAVTNDGHTLARVKAQDLSITDAIVENTVGDGYTLYIGPDLLYSIVHIQQGAFVPRQTRRVRYDAAAGITLDVERDRVAVPGEEDRTRRFEGGIQGEAQTRVFLEPVTDELRGIIIRGILYSCRKQNIPMPMLWYWPENIPAVAHLSHDTDGNNQELAWSLYNVLKGMGIKTTWCTLYPGGYTREFYNALKENDYEIALHYDASDSSEYATWSQSNFNYQCDWLMKEAQIPKVVTNKSHLLRWEGILEFYKWLEARGVEVEESKGANDPVNNGFPFGGSHPWFPLDDDMSNPRFIDVMEINLMTQDVNARCTPHLAKLFADKACKHYGVVHYLIHPGGFGDPRREEGLREMASHVRGKGMAWWKAESIGRWERARRKVSILPIQTNPDLISYRISTPDPLKNGTLLFLLPNGDNMKLSIKVDGKPMDYEKVKRYGFTFAMLIHDLADGQSIEIARLTS